MMKREEITDTIQAMRVVCYYNTFAAQWNSRELDRQRGAIPSAPCSDEGALLVTMAHSPRVRGPLFQVKGQNDWYSIDPPPGWVHFADDLRFPFNRNFIPFPPLPRVWRYAMGRVGR